MTTEEQKIKELTEENALLKELTQRLSAEALQFGYTLRSEFFIPEYLGFKEETLQDPDPNSGVTMAVFYIKDGYSIARGENDYWLIFSAKNEVKNKLKITNMLEGIYALRLSGMDVSIDDVYSDTKDAEKADQMIDEYFDEDSAKELKEAML